MNYDPNKAIRQALMVARRQAAYGGQQSYPGYRPINPLAGLPEDEGAQVVGSSASRPIGGAISDGGNDPGTPGPQGAPGTGNFVQDVTSFGKAAGPALGGMAIGGLLGGPAGAVMGAVGSTMAQGLAEATGLSAPATSPPGGFASVAGNIAQTQMGMTPTSNPVDAITAAVTGPQAPADQEDADQGAAQSAAAAAAAADNANSMSEAATADAAADSDGGTNGDSGGAGGDGDGGPGGDFARGGNVKGGMDPRSLPGIHLKTDHRFADGGGVIDDIWLHGTAGEHKELSRTHEGSVTKATAPGIWFTKNKNYASEYAQNAAYLKDSSPRIVSAKLNLKNPLIVNFNDRMKPVVAGEEQDWDDNNDIMKHAIRHGHDGVIFPNGNFSEESESAAVLDPNKIKIIDHGYADGGGVQPEEEEGFDAYHGSPHEFEQFDSSKIGTGEGAQAFGYGHYLAENEGVARSYRDKLTNLGDDIKLGNYEYDPATLRSYINDPKELDRDIKLVKSQLEKTKKLFQNHPDGDVYINSAQRYVDHYENLKRIPMDQWPEIPQGHMYHVRVKAKPEHFLDWDAPLSEQHPQVVQALDQAFPSAMDYWRSVEGKAGDNGGHFHAVAAEDLSGSTKKGHEQIASKLQAAGIPGIKYFDRDSRDKGKGTRNYVIFDPDMIQVKRRYADGGQIMPQRDLGADPAVQQALDITRGYQDPPTKHIEDWQWKPLPEVQQRLGGMREIPSHVQAFGNYMDEIAKRAGNEGLSARDLIKAYTITRASIQRRANDVDRVRAAGLDLPKSFTGKIRPEGAFGEWLHTRPGQDYLDSAERGEANEDAIANAVKVMTPFGKHEKDIPDALRWAAANLPGKEQVISTLVANAMRGASEPAEWRSMAKDVRGIGPSKAGFLASLMGRGDQPTLDARQIIEHTGRPTSEAQTFLRRKGGEGATEAVERLSARQRAMNFELPEELKPYYQHLAHHAVWDKAADEVTTHEDVMNAMRGAASGGEIDAGSILSHPVVHAMRMAGLPKLEVTRRANGGGVGDDLTVQRAMDITRQMQPSAPQIAAAVQPQAKPVQYKSWADVPTINPQDLVGKRVFPIFADLTKAGSAFTGIDASQLSKPEQLYGGPGYPLLPESQEKGLAWAVEGKGRGSAKIRKDADYVVVSSMMPHSHQSNASFSNALMKNMDAYVRDKRLAPEDIQQIDDMIRRPTEQKELQGLQEFPGFAHPEAENFLRGISFEQRKRISNVLASKEAQALGAPNIDKITRETLDPEFSGVPSRHGMFLLEIPKGSEDEQLVNLKAAGLPEHPSYQYGIKGRVVGKFHYPVAPEVLFKDWFDKAHAEASQKEKSNVRRAFDLAMPVGTVTQEIADMLPRHPRDIQSGKAARLALNAFNDQWAHTDDPVNKGGIGAAEFSQALKNSDFSSTLSQYSAEDINKMKKDKNFTGYKLKDGEVYFGLKRNTNYADDYGFEHPELSPNETALVSVVNNEPGAKGIGGAPVVLKAIQEGATALDCYAVPSQKHPKGFLPNFYSHFGFKELGRIPFDPQYVTQTQFDDMKHQWRKSGWDETMGMPSLVVMKWDGKDADRSDAVQNFVRQSGEGVEPGRNSTDVAASAGVTEQGIEPPSGRSRVGRQSDPGGDRGAVRTDRNARSADRFTRTLSEIKSLSPEEARHFGLDPAEVEDLRQQFLPKAFGGSTVDKALRLTAPARPMVALADLFQRQLRGRPPS